MGNTIGKAYGLLDGLTASMQNQMAGKISNAVSNNSNSASFASVMTQTQNAGAQSTETKSAADKDKAELNPAKDQQSNSDRIAGEEKHDARKTSATDKKQDEQTQVSKSEKADEAASVSDDVKATTSDEGVSEKELEEVSEALAGIVNQLFENVIQILQITPEEANAVLSDMNMSQADLLKPENLSAFTLQVMGAEDSLALLTNETQYEQFQNVLGELNDVISSDSRVADMSADELNELISELKLKDGSESEVIDVTTFDRMPANEENDVKVNAKAATQEVVADKSVVLEDGQTLGAEALEKNGRKSQQQSQQFENESGAAGQFDSPLQNFDNTVQNVEEAAQTQRYADTQEIANQILEHIRSEIKPDMQSLEIQLHPASLGNVQVNLTNKEGNLTASFVAQNEQVKAVLEGQMIQLQERFEEQGIKVTSIEVSVGANGFQQSFEQQAREEQQEAARPKVRRLRLNMGLEDLNIEDLSDDERLAAQMMQANGQTVDLQA